MTSASAARGPGGGPWRRKWARRRLNSGSTATRRPASSIVALACPHQVIAMVIGMDPVYLSPVYLETVYPRPVASNPGYSSHAGPASPGARSSPRVRANHLEHHSVHPNPGGG